MDQDRLQVRFWGVRGSVPVSGPQFARFGGNTACVEFKCGEHTFFIDAGSGLRPAGDRLTESGVSDFDVFFTHSHYDHIIGLPFVRQLYDPKVKMVLWSGHLFGRMTTRQLVSDLMRPPWFPVELDSCGSNLFFRDFAPGDVLTPRPGVTLRTGSLNHPGGCVGYRLEWQGRSVALISDTEHTPGELEPSVIELIRDADLVIYDCTYTDAEMKRYRGFGHSSWQQGVRLCRAAEAKRLALFHHEPGRTDAQLDEIEREATENMAGAFAARDGMLIEL